MISKNKHGALELSISTVVIVVLGMTMLILGLVLVRTIFTSTTDSVKEIDQGVKNEIRKLFDQNEGKQLILYPDSKKIQLKKGSQGEGFALSIRNTDTIDTSKFTSEVVMADQGSCPENPIDSEDVTIIAGQTITTGDLSPKDLMLNPVHVRLAISDTAPACLFRLRVDLYKGETASGSTIDFDYIDVEIVAK